MITGGHTIFFLNMIIHWESRTWWSKPVMVEAWGDGPEPKVHQVGIQVAEPKRLMGMEFQRLRSRWSCKRTPKKLSQRPQKMDQHFPSGNPEDVSSIQFWLMKGCTSSRNSCVALEVCLGYMGLYGGFLKWGYVQIIYFRLGFSKP